MPTRDTKTPSSDPQQHADVTPGRSTPRERSAPRPAARPAASAGEHEGATEDEVGDRTGPGAGYDDEPAQDDDRGGVA